MLVCIIYAAKDNIGLSVAVLCQSSPMCENVGEGMGRGGGCGEEAWLKLLQVVSWSREFVLFIYFQGHFLIRQFWRTDGTKGTWFSVSEYSRRELALASLSMTQGLDVKHGTGFESSWSQPHFFWAEVY